MMGTKEQFKSFLLGKGMTYTSYTKLSIEAKVKLYREYEGRGRKAKAPQADKSAPGQPAALAGKSLVSA
jgi:hypothetical protein